MRAVITIGVGFGCLGLVFGAAGMAAAQGGWTGDRVGIGTTTPGAKLHVAGSVVVDGRVMTDMLSAPGIDVLHFTVGGKDALRLDPTTGSPNIIGGAGVNTVNPEVVGGTIAGGGDPEGSPQPNVITGSYGSIGGDFLACRDNTGFGEAAKCHINGAGTFVAGSDFAEALPARGVTRIDADDIAVAIIGIVPTKVSAENGAIKPGDLLTTATVSGHAMKASPVMVSGIALYPTGTILGKALGSLDSGTGLIRVLVTLK